MHDPLIIYANKYNLNVTLDNLVHTIVNVIANNNRSEILVLNVSFQADLSA